MSDQVHILEELALPDSNTWAPCEAFLQRLARLRPSSQCFPPVLIYGDATGNERQTAASRTDWQIVREFFNRYPDKIDIRVCSLLESER